MNITANPESFFEGFFDSSFKFPDTRVTAERRVELFEIEIFSEYGGITYINGESRNIRPGLVVCAHPGDIRHSELPLRCHYVKVSCEMRELCEILKNAPRFSRVRNFDYCTSLIQDMLTANIANNDMLRISRLFELISVLSEEGTQQEKLHTLPHKKSREAIETAILYMEQNFAQKCSLEDIAKAAHFSPIYFHTIFKEAVGKTPYEYLTDIRINEAKRLLITGMTDMNGIAEKCGFSSQSYFNYVFKKETNLTPSAYRRSHIEKYSLQ